MIVHQLIPFLAPLGEQSIIWIFSNLRVSTFQKSMMGCPNWQLLSKIEVFYRPEWTKGETTSECILTILKSKNDCYKQLEQKKQMKKMGPFVQFPCFFPEFWSVNCPKKCIFYNFVLTSARNLSLLKQFTFMHLKVLITLFQKMLCFIVV